MVVDPPSWFALIEDLQAFLREAASLPQDDPAVQASIEGVKSAIEIRSNAAKMKRPA
jgi:hypothetical protein